ncbi:hypothetical protein DY000_02053581 [Brassica cretica]|uniref:Uncharacterized protein n=1 Tax=Brassica cretica TaxID=69181 RepID=A0ABQ7ALA9_BRACR|nr:hypothetical protein DY000_02053581 [Brassica cretica]
MQGGDFNVESPMSFGGSHWCRSRQDHEHRSTVPSPNQYIGSPEHRSMTPTESTASCNVVRILTHEEFAAKHSHPPNLYNMPKIDVARLNALRPKPKPSENPPETVRIPSDDGEDSMEVDRELLNTQTRDETDQLRSEAAWERTQSSRPIDRANRPSIDRANRPSIDINPPTSIDVAHTTSIHIRSKPNTTVSEKDKFDNEYLTPDEFGVFRDPDGYARAIDGRILNVSRNDIADIHQTANGAENLFVHQCNIPEYQQKDTKEFYDTAGGIDKSFKQRSRHPTRPSIDVDVPTSVDRRPEFGRRAFDFYGTRNFYREEKNEYGVYRDDQGYARDLEGRTIHSTKDTKVDQPVNYSQLLRLFEGTKADLQH